MKNPRMVIAVVVAVVIAVVFAVMFSQSDETETQTSPPPTLASDNGGASDGGGELEDGLQKAPLGDEIYGAPDEGLADGSDSDKADSKRAAEAFAKEWVSGKDNRADWASRVQPLILPDAWNYHNLPEPRRITPSEVTGEAVADPDEGVTTETALYLVPTDAGDLAVTLVKEDGTWLVSAVDKEL